MAKGFFDILSHAALHSSVFNMSKSTTPIKIASSATSISGQRVSDETALKLSAVWACVGLISEMIATLPLNLYERQSDGSRKVASDHPLQDILHHNPNYNNTCFEFWQAQVAAMLLKGNAYGEIKGDKRKRIISIEYLNAGNIKIEQTSSGELIYKYKDAQDKDRVIPESNIIHLRAFSLDGLAGLSPITYGANVMGSAMSAESAASNTFKNGLLPTVAFKTEKVLSKIQREEFREYTKTISGAMRAGLSPVLEAGISAESIGISPEDAQLIESRAFSVQEICRWFRVPPWMIGHTEKSTSWGTGMEQQMIGFATFTLNPWTRRIEQSINKHLLKPEERKKYYAEFSLDGLLRGDSAARASFYSAMTQNGIYTRDECRAKENLPRFGGNANVLTVQTNLSPIDKLGQSKD